MHTVCWAPFPSILHPICPVLIVKSQVASAYPKVITAQGWFFFIGNVEGSTAGINGSLMNFSISKGNSAIQC